MRGIKGSADNGTRIATVAGDGGVSTATNGTRGDAVIGTTKVKMTGDGEAMTPSVSRGSARVGSTEVESIGTTTRTTGDGVLKETLFRELSCRPVRNSV
jgi:hypothetical protein